MPINANTMYYNLTLANRINMYKASLEKSTERLSTGKVINSAADSPSDILRISRLRSQIMGSHAAQRNIQDALSLTQVMDGALSQMQDMGLRLKELSVRYNDSAITADERSVIEKEAIGLAKEMKMVMESTEFGGINVFGNSQYYFQTGNSVNDNITIKNPLSDIEINAHTQSTGINALSAPSVDKETTTKTYDISVNAPSGQSLTGEIDLNLKDVEKDKDIDFTINTSNGETSKGKLSFIDDDTARFELHVKKSVLGCDFNIKYTGTLQLNSSASKTDLSGEGSYTLDSQFGGSSGKVTFTLKSQEEDPTDPGDPSDPGDPGNGGDIDFEDIDKIPVSQLLRGDFVDKNILQPIANSRAGVGIEQRLLEYRLTRQTATEEITTNALSKIEDADMAKELMNKMRSDILLQTNIQLLSQNLDDQRNYILDILKER